MADKMMRMAGRGFDGRAKAVKTDDLGNLGVAVSEFSQEPFSGNGNTKKLFENDMTAIVVSNDGDEDIKIVVNGFSFEIKAGEVFEERFSPFNEVTVIGNVPFRAYGKGSGVLVVEIYHTLLRGETTRTTSQSTVSKKGSEFEMKKTKELLSIGAKGTPLSFEIWETDSSHKIISPAPLLTGTFSNYTFKGYKTSRLNNGVKLLSGKYYYLSVDYGSNTDVRLALKNDTPEGYTNNDTVRATGFSLQGGVHEGATISAETYVYDYRLELV